MVRNQFILDVHDEMIVDNFAGVPEMAAWRNGERHEFKRKVKAWRQGSLQILQAA